MLQILQFRDMPWSKAVHSQGALKCFQFSREIQGDSASVRYLGTATGSSSPF